MVRQSFQRQIQRIEDRRTLLADTKTSLTLDLSVLSKSQQEHDQKMEKLKIMKMETTNRCQRILNDVAELSRAISVVYNTHTSQDKDDEKEIEGQLSISRPLSSDRNGHSTAEKNGSGDGRVSEVADENENKGEDETEKEGEKDLYLSAAAHLKAIDRRLCIAMEAQVNHVSVVLSFFVVVCCVVLCCVVLYFVVFCSDLHLCIIYAVRHIHVLHPIVCRNWQNRASLFCSTQLTILSYLGISCYIELYYLHSTAW